MVPIAVPSLEERREDIPVLAEHFISSVQCGPGIATAPGMTDEAAIALMQTMVWPGNVRQLKNLIERVLILGEGTGPIEAKRIAQQMTTRKPTEGRVVLSGALATLPLREARERRLSANTC